MAKYIFAGYTGAVVSPANPVTVQVTTDATVTANYSLVTRRISFSSQPIPIQVSVQVGSNPAVPLRSGQYIDVPEGESVTVTAPSEVVA